MAPESSLMTTPRDEGNGKPYETLVTDDVRLAAKFIRRGHPVAFPTETVFGLGVSVYDERAIRRIYEAKGRPSSNPLISHVSDLRQIEELTSSISNEGRLLMDAFFPGPLTLVMKRSDRVPDEATAGLDTVAVRMPDHPVALELIRTVGEPLVAPSANRSGRPSPTTWESVLEDLDGRIACILKGERSRSGLESTVVDCSDSPPLLLRPGSIPAERLRRIVPHISMEPSGSDKARRSPGTRFRHYAPDARVVLVREASEAVPASDAAYIGLSGPDEEDDFGLVRICADEADYAYELFDFLRECDREKMNVIYCEAPDPTGIGRALLDRLMRASERGRHLGNHESER